MELNDLLGYIQQYGYFALFFCLWLGIAGMPIPDEMIVMTGGFVSGLEILHPLPAFLLTYLGVISGLSIGYLLGRYVGSPVLERISKKKNSKYLDKSQQLINRYGHYALILSYFIPVVRHVVPYLVGINKMPFKLYALFSFSTGFVWTLIYFILGIFFGQYIEHIVVLVKNYGIVFGLIVGLCFILHITYSKLRTRGQNEQPNNSIH